VFWWSEPGDEASRVELELHDVEEGTLIRVTESRPLALLDGYGRDLATELGVPRPGMPEMLAGAGSLR
jgi:hypothetical protein